MKKRASNNISIHLDDLQKRRVDEDAAIDVKDWTVEDLNERIPRTRVKMAQFLKKKEKILPDVVMRKSVGKKLRVSKGFKHKMNCYGLNQYLVTPDKPQELKVGRKSKDSLAKSIETSIRTVRQSLPLHFLLTHGHDFAIETALENLCRNFAASHRRSQFSALNRWKGVVNEARIEQRAAQVVLLTRVSGLSQCFALVQRKHRIRKRRVFRRWKTTAFKIRDIEYRIMSTRIQCAWRCTSARHTLAVLKYEARMRLEYTSALLIQRIFRGFQGRLVAAAWKKQVIECRAALIIQHCMQNYMIRTMFQRERRRRATFQIQTVYRGYLGQKKAFLRQKAFQHVALSLYQTYCAIGVAKATQQHYSAVMIQRSFRFYTTRQVIQHHREFWARKRRYFPARSIQLFWRYGQVNLVQYVLVRVVLKAALVYSSRSKVIQRAFRDSVVRHRNRSAAKIQSVPRMHLARKKMYAEQHVKIARGYEGLTHCGIFTSSLAVITATGFVSSALLRERFRNIRALFYRLNSIYTHSATRIQCRARGMLAMLYGQRLRPARAYLEAEIPPLVKIHVVKLRRKRVLHRWRCKRHRIFSPALLIWKEYTVAMKAEKAMRRAKQHSTTAVWHWQWKKYQLVLNGFRKYIETRRFKKSQKQIAKLHFIQQKWKKWDTNCQNYVVDDIVWKTKCTVTLFHLWRINSRYFRLSRSAKHLFFKTHCTKGMTVWKEHCQRIREKMKDAEKHYDQQLQAKAFRKMHKRVRLLKTCDKLFNSTAQSRGVVAWRHSVTYFKHVRAQEAKADEFYRRELEKKVVRYWMRLKQVRLDKEALRRKGDAHFVQVTRRRSVLQWTIHAWIRCEYNDMVTLADDARRLMLYRHGYDVFQGYWAQHIGKLKIQSAIKFQSLWRGKKARRHYAGIKALHQYQFETRVKNQTDVSEFSAEEYDIALHSTQWVIVLFYLPWEPLSPEVRREYAKSATTLRRLPSTRFVIVDASTSAADGRSLSLRYSLTDNFPSIFLFWNGKGILSPCLPQKYLSVCTSFNSEISCSNIVSWISHSIESCRFICARSIQARIRGYLCRCRLYRERIALEHDTAGKLQQWYRYRREIKRIGKINREAYRIQRWHAQRLCTIRFKKDVTERMETIRAPIKCIQRAIRCYFCRQFLARILEEKNATPETFRNAPICCECEETLGLSKCTDCADVYCDTCFAEYHNKGARARHLTVPIAFRSMHENRNMCPLCEVQDARRVCLECVEVYCTICFEAAHNKRSGPVLHKWCSSLAPPLEYKGNRGVSAQEVIKSNEWLTLQHIEDAQAAEAEKQRLAEERQLRLEELCAENEDLVYQAFELYDEDKSGWIDRDELKNMLLKELCQPVTDKELDEAMDVIDSNGNGQIEFDELLLWISKGMLDGGKKSGKTALLRKTLEAKRKIRKFKENLAEKMPSLPEDTKPPPTVPGYSEIHLISMEDYETRRHIFLRFIQTEYNFNWVLEDADRMDEENLQNVFAELFLPRWNSGELGHQYYFDGLKFGFQDQEWQYLWSTTTNRYIFKNLGDETEDFVDPRKKQGLYQDAREAFDAADLDQSGSLDEDEFFQMLRDTLCEPVTRKQSSVYFEEMDLDHSRLIDFNEFLIWYASEQSQNYNYSSKLQALRVGLKARKTAKATLLQAADLGQKQGKALVDTISTKIQKTRLEMDSRGASPELLELLLQGHSKTMGVKALAINSNNVELALNWLNKQAEIKEQVVKHQQEERRKLIEEKTAGLKKISKFTISKLSKAKTSFKAKTHRKTQKEKVDELVGNLEHELFKAGELDDLDL